MPSPSKDQLKHLADQIQAIEERGWSARGTRAARDGHPHADPSEAVATGWAEVDRVLGGGGHDEGSAGDDRAGSVSITGLSRGLRRGALHEWFGVSGPAEAQERCGAPWTPPLCLLVHLAWQALVSPSLPASCGAPFRANGSGAVVWIGRRCWPHPRVMVRCEAGFNEVGAGEEAEGKQLLQRSLFADPSGLAARLWAVDLALRSPAVTAVVADGSGFDMAATRRLQLAAESGRGMALLARPREELSLLSVAATRWGVAWASPSAREEPLAGDGRSVRDGRPAREAGAWGPEHVGEKCETRFRPRWELTLRRCRSQRTAVRAEHQWVLEWKRGRFVVVASSELVGRPGHSSLEEADRIAVRRTA